ncbi:hypothetical protein [Litchfieldia salsa]|uniref:Photosystem I assembly protein Ycf4 n=1 Tax=Litchfieldia salsa TaxID=930152 RepID=A0A1H0VXK7_9BACI|nr:hypothetical protein [Litchfieldia salsa]SDP82856.1 hypothetical protein SAMN05216565_10823 [Litchfieldia salsa]
MTEKVFYPNTKGILKTMGIVYLIVAVFGSVLNTYDQSNVREWTLFLKVSLIYIFCCSSLYFLIKSQRIILNEKELILKLAGMKRHHILLSRIGEIRKGKMNGSPIIEIIVKNEQHKRIYPLPFLPFQLNWEEMLQHIGTICGKEVVGEMTLKREKGELRTWE